MDEAAFVKDAVEAARESFRLYVANGCVLDEARSVLALATMELHAIECDAEAFARGERTLAAVVYPARMFASILAPLPDDE